MRPLNIANLIIMGFTANEDCVIARKHSHSLVIPAQAGIPFLRLRGKVGWGGHIFFWVPACAGTTKYFLPNTPKFCI